MVGQTSRGPAIGSFWRREDMIETLLNLMDLVAGPVDYATYRRHLEAESDDALFRMMARKLAEAGAVR